MITGSRSRPKAVNGYESCSPMKNKYGFLFPFASILFTHFFCCCICAQEDENRLARPEWQLRADLEFQLACQKAKDMLCRDIVRSLDAEAEPGSRPCS